MNAGKLPFDEKRRLEALRHYGVLDTEPEEALDDLTALAATICDVPIALITLVDEQRQWFKSKVGLAAAETSREVSFCVHALETPDLFVVPDALLDVRFAENPLVTGDPGIRFYAGAPLISPEGEALGTLCVMDRVPRTLAAKQELALRVLGRQVMTHLKLRRQWRELQASEGKLRAIFEAEPECVKLLGADATFREMNAAGLRLLEADDLKTVTGQSLLPLVVPEDREAVRAMLEAVARGERQTVEYRIIGLKGTLRWVEMNGAPFRDGATGENLILGVSHDITGRRHGEMELRERGELLQAIVDHIPVMLCFSDETGRMSWVNREAERVSGWTLAEIQAHPDIFTEWYPDPAYRAEVLAFGREATGKFAEFHTRTQGGRVIPTSFANVLVADGTSVGIGLDISEQKRSDARFRWLVDSNAQGVMFWNKRGEVTGANDAFLDLVGYSREDLEAGRVDWAAMTPPEYADLDRQSMAEIAAKGGCAPFEKAYIRKDGSRVPVLLGAAAFEDNPEEGVCFAVDLTVPKKLEQQSLRAQRMESIGTLAGGIAHDLNNTLGPIIMSLDLLKLRFPDSASLEMIEIINASAQRGADMVRQVLSFARGVEGRRMEVQVKHLIGEIEKIANDTFFKHIQVRTNVASDLWTVLGDPTQLHQVLLNLCVNARDAMPNGGKLAISAENIALDAHYAGMNAEAKPGPYVLIRVEDNGTGMPPHVIEKIFDPFFTTKEIGKGTGLGLSTSLAIVKSHGGFLRVYSEPGKGTKFHLNLPAQVQPFTGLVEEVVAELPRGNGELILVVDDEVSIRLITQQTLEAFGYRVLLAVDGAEAVALYAGRDTEIAAVLTDMMMPIMDGPATILILRRMNPTLPIIAASGLSANGQSAAGLGVQRFIPKPYTAATILKALKEVLTPAA